MALSLSDVMKMKQRERQFKDSKIKEKAQEYVEALKQKEAQRKLELARQEMAMKEKLSMEMLREKERQRIEDERKRKRYFEVDKYNRKIPAADSPVYFGDMLERNSAWQPHGKGEFSVNDEIIMKGEFNKSDFVQGVVKWSDGSVWDGRLINHKMDGVGFITENGGVKREAMMRNNTLICYKDGKS